jgi:hypothetical protein
MRNPYAAAWPARYDSCAPPICDTWYVAGYAPLVLSFSIGQTGGAMSSSSEPDRLDSRRSDALVPSVIEELKAKGRRV